MTLVFGGWSVSPKVSVFLIALVSSAVAGRGDRARAQHQLAVAGDGQRLRPVGRPRSGARRLALIVFDGRAPAWSGCPRGSGSVSRSIDLELHPGDAAARHLGGALDQPLLRGRVDPAADRLGDGGLHPVAGRHGVEVVERDPSDVVAALRGGVTAGEQARGSWPPWPCCPRRSSSPGSTPAPCRRPGSGRRGARG